MGIKSSRNGMEGERLARDYLFFHLGMWVHSVARSYSGAQPVDILALKGHDSFLIDAKYVRLGKKSFTFDDIQPNQVNAMKLAKDRSDAKCGFFIFFEELFEEDKDIQIPKILTFDKFIELYLDGHKSINMNSEDLIDGKDFADFIRLG